MKSDEDANKKLCQAPKGGGDHTGPNDTVIIACWGRPLRFISVAQGPDEQAGRDVHDDQGMHLIAGIARPICYDGGQGDKAQ